MPIQQVRIGSNEDFLQYDDADYDTAIETDQPIKIGAPVDLDHAAQLADVPPEFFTTEALLIAEDVIEGWMAFCQDTQALYIGVIN